MKITELLKGIFAKNGQRESEQIFDEAQLKDVKRNCWLPLVESGDGAVTASKFSGIPYLAQDESWPVCPNCQNPIQLFVQLNSDDLPATAGKPWGDGLLQFFYCTNLDPMCDTDCQAWSPFSRSTLLRIITPDTNPPTYSETPVINAFPAKRIVGWTEHDDYPNWEELRKHEITLPDSVLDKLGESFPHEGEKLLGWPLWVQGIEYPNCPTCDMQMQLVFQIDSNQNIPFDFGDVGIGHISQCPVHPRELGFGWACY